MKREVILSFDVPDELCARDLAYEGLDGVIVIAHEMIVTAAIAYQMQVIMRAEEWKKEGRMDAHDFTLRFQDCLNTLAVSGVVDGETIRRPR
jgi:hypothetical protein